MSTIVMDAHGPRRMTAEEHAQGFSVCPCEKFAHIFRSEVLRRLPREYSGELCPECSMWMCSVEKLREAGFDIANAPAQGREAYPAADCSTIGGKP